MQCCSCLMSKISLAEPRLLIERDIRPGTDAIQDLCSLQPTVHTNKIVESLYIMTSAYLANINHCITIPYFLK